MKQLNETFEDKVFEILKKTKGKKTWREFILELEHHMATTVGLWATDRPDKIPKELKEKYFWELEDK